MPPCGRPAGADRLSSAWLRCPLPPKNPRTASPTPSLTPRSDHQPRAVFCAALWPNLQPALTPVSQRAEVVLLHFGTVVPGEERSRDRGHPPARLETHGRKPGGGPGRCAVDGCKDARALRPENDVAYAHVSDRDVEAAAERIGKAIEAAMTGGQLPGPTDPTVRPGLCQTPVICTGLPTERVYPRAGGGTPDRSRPV